jgi:sarcosine oxidase, subunit gamma
MFKPPQLRSCLGEFLEASRQRPGSERTGLYLSERPFMGHLNLRGETGHIEFFERVERCLGISPPQQPNTYKENAKFTICWFGPNEWLLITPPRSEGDTARQLRGTLQGLFFAVTDVTHGQTVIRIRGDRTLDVLRKGCSLDLHPTVFGPGCCAQTLLGKAGIAIRWVDASPSFDLIVRRSYAEYLALWLGDAAEEYGFAASSGEVTENAR